MKKILFQLILLITFLSCKNIVLAETRYKGTVTGNEVNIRKGPSTNYSIIKALSINSTYDLVSNTLYPDEKGCSDGWYQLYYSGSSTAYICSKYLSVTSYEYEEPTNDLPACEKELTEKGFSKTYIEPLCKLKAKYPKWNFVADKNGISFSTAVEKESSGTKSKIETSYEGYKSTKSYYDFLTNKFTAVESGTWYVADSRVVAYYLDPRVWLSEEWMFQFEKLSFDESYQTLDTIKAVLAGRDILEKAEVIYNVGKELNVNPVYLASRIRQETGGNYTNNSIMGKSITYDNKYYEHVYNAYNIGANTGYLDGLYYAVKGTAYGKPWITLDKAINGGAQFIAKDYVGKGQDTGYFQKFNVSSYTSYSTYSHQYMTNVKAASSEGKMNYNAYKGMDLLSMPFTFVIPVYENMPDAISVLPSKENPNNHLKDLKVNGTSIEGFLHNTFEYTFYISPLTEDINIEGIVIIDGTTVTGDTKIKILPEETEKNATITVTAKNGDTQNYTVKIIKSIGVTLKVSEIMESLPLKINNEYIGGFTEGYTATSFKELVNSKSNTAVIVVKNSNNIEKNNEILVTGDVINITNDNDSKTYNVIINGDVSGDASITIVDLLKVQKHILNYNKLENAYFKAGDTNNDGKVDIVDLLRIQKHILGYTKLS